jgi:hypothetical protein
MKKREKQFVEQTTRKNAICTHAATGRALMIWLTHRIGQYTIHTTKSDLSE